MVKSVGIKVRKTKKGIKTERVPVKQTQTKKKNRSSGGISSGPNQNFTPNVQPTSNLSNITPTATVQPQPQQPILNTHESTGTFTAATPMQKFSGTPLGEFVSGIKETILGQTDLSKSPTGAHTLGALVGYAGAITSFSAVAAIGETVVANLAKVGTVGVVEVATTTAETIAANPVTRATTASWLTKLASTVKDPTFVVGTLMASIGSYPFSGFIKEEALQTISFAVSSAIENNDVELATQAIELQKEILDPNLWNQIKANIPFVNVLDKLDDFYEAARLKITVDEKIVNDLKIQIDTGETQDQKWARVNQEQADQDKAAVDYYNQERQKLLTWEREAAKDARNEDAAFWAKEAEKQRKLEEADRKAIADFWEAYKRRAQKIANDNRPSKLNFGIL